LSERCSRKVLDTALPSSYAQPCKRSSLYPPSKPPSANASYTTGEKIQSNNQYRRRAHTQCQCYQLDLKSVPSRSIVLIVMPQSRLRPIGSAFLPHVHTASRRFLYRAILLFCLLPRRHHRNLQPVLAPR
jgi:hypothetical protein